MRIAIDGSCWTNHRGYGRYTRGLLKAMMALDDGHEYVVFMDAATARRATDLPPRARCVIVPTSGPATEKASASGHRSWRDLAAMSWAARAHARQYDLLYFPSVYTFFPLQHRTTIVVTIHDTIAEQHPGLIFPTRRSQLMWQIKVRWALHQADTIVTVSSSAKKDIVRMFHVPEHAVRIVPDAVDETFHPVSNRAWARRVLEQRGVGLNDRLLLYVGGLSPHKNLHTLLDAFGILSRDGEGRELKLALIGDFERDPFFSNHDALRQHARDLGLSEQVIFAGFVSDADLVQCYNAADAVVLPSLAEGFGLPALEAMACGTPVVASRIEPLEEVVGDAGLFFDPRSPEDLVRCLRRALTDAELRQRLSLRGPERARTFSWGQSARAALAVFEELVSAHGQRFH